MVWLIWTGILLGLIGLSLIIVLISKDLKMDILWLVYIVILLIILTYFWIIVLSLYKYQKANPKIRFTQTQVPA